jgi:hypothetical protein
VDDVEEEDDGSEESEEDEAESEVDVDELLAGPSSSSAKETYKEGSFVVAVYDKEWFIAQVDHSQQETPAGYTRLRYMRKVGNNRFIWEKHQDLLDTLDLDILMSIPDPIPVASRFMGLHVSHAKKADQLLLVHVVYISFNNLIKNFATKLNFFLPKLNFFYFYFNEISLNWPFK